MFASHESRLSRLETRMPAALSPEAKEAKAEISRVVGALTDNRRHIKSGESRAAMEAEAVGWPVKDWRDFCREAGADNFIVAARDFFRVVDENPGDKAILAEAELTLHRKWGIAG